MKLNLGCGNDRREGYVNVDCAKLPGVHKICDLNALPLPFESDSCEEILCKDVLEHLESFPAIMYDLHRILKKGGVLKIVVPHFSSGDAYSDPTHRNFFAAKTFGFFVSGHERCYYGDSAFSQLRKLRITFAIGGHSIPPLEWIFNFNGKMQVLYDYTFLSRLFPAAGICAELVK